MCQGKRSIKSTEWTAAAAVGSYLAPYAKMMSPMRIPKVPSRNQTSGWCLKTSALTRMENPSIAPTRELNPGGGLKALKMFVGSGVCPVFVAQVAQSWVDASLNINLPLRKSINHRYGVCHDCAYRKSIYCNSSTQNKWLDTASEKNLLQYMDWWLDGH